MNQQEVQLTPPPLTPGWLRLATLFLQLLVTIGLIGFGIGYFLPGVGQVTWVWLALLVLIAILNVVRIVRQLSSPFGTTKQAQGRRQ